MSAHDGERSPKRQRLDSYSPASPRPTAEPTKTFVPNYSTPPPSVRMSPSWTAQSQTSQQLQHQPGGSNFPSPPSTAGFQNRMANRDSEHGGSGHHTPASQDDGDIRKDGDGDSEMTDRRENPGDGHRRSDHERQRGEGHDAATSSSNAVPQLYRIRTSPIVPSRPHASQNLLALYDLSAIQKRVARVDDAGNKIKLRKSYASKVKNLGLEGLNKAAPNQGELRGLVDPDWNFETAPGQTLWDQTWQELKLGDSAAENELLGKLDSALQFQPGRLPRNEHEAWKKTLGLDESTLAAKSLAASKDAKRPVPNAHLAKTAPATAMRSSAPSSPRNGQRLDRAGKKRSYGDSSFEGYGEGYEDDTDLDDNGRRRDSSKRQKRKEFPSNANSPAFSSGGGSSMVGVRSS
ncbi:Mediator of RNA polymerase II transcription subunit 19 [Cercospora beticola]|uniref:Mediator of RNA polymerase II transcription subunit 19 n=1 Tax=Cercospora beticola TaxID=122368 RepID=A0A2G5I6Z1_CERBT|nr:Mediator of RNA polymerase II transcription subunit 19 [Cercospora beticola]PIB00492.1 Mediator of RNA polymerase II transcription subunit 19 [Cercospora beticola]CAK1355923.1 unnamed protein product [Cercospora beticola]